MSGDGVCTWQDPEGKRYSGEFHRNKRHGFGTMVWPHMLVRVMLAEQIYRAVSIAAGTPYHRV